MERQPPRRGTFSLSCEGGYVPFDVAEAIDEIAKEFNDLPTEEARRKARRIINYLASIMSSIKLVTRFKPWKWDNGFTTSAYRKGFYDGWRHLQEIVKFEMTND